MQTENRASVKRMQRNVNKNSQPTYITSYRAT